MIITLNAILFFLCFISIAAIACLTVWHQASAKEIKIQEQAIGFHKFLIEQLGREIDSLDAAIHKVEMEREN